MKPPSQRSRPNASPRTSRAGASPTPTSHPPVRPAEVRRSRGRLLLALYVVLLAECAAALFTSTRLGVRHVAVIGVDRLPASEAGKIVQRSMTLARRNWLIAPIGSVQRELEQMPWVNTAQVARELPDRVRVIVHPRRPVLTAQIGSERYEVDGEQMPIRIASAASAGLPLVTLNDIAAARCGSRIHDEGLAAATHILQKLSDLPGGGIPKIEVDQNRNLCLNMQDGMSIQIGQTENIDAKIDMVRRVYTRRPDVARALARIDLTCPSAPVCILRAVSSTSRGTAPDEGRFN